MGETGLCKQGKKGIWNIIFEFPLSTLKAVCFRGFLLQIIQPRLIKIESFIVGKKVNL